MKIVHTLNDGVFKADSIESLRKQVEDYYSINGYIPKVTIDDQWIIIELDEDLLKKAHTDYSKAAELCNQRRFDEAKVLIRKALKIFPAYSDAHRTLAQIEMEKGNIDEAMDINLEALKCDPRNIWALVLMGNLLIMKKNPQAARTYFDKVLVYDPYNYIANTNIGAILLEENKDDEALNYFDQSIKANSTYPNGYYGKAMVYLHKNNPGKAFSIAHEGCLKAKDTPENVNIQARLTGIMIEAAKRRVKEINYQNIIDAIVDIIQDEDKTPIEFIRDEKQLTYAHLEYADNHNRNKHLLKYKQSEVTPHLVLHELMHLSMNNKAKAAGRNKFVVYSDGHYQRFAKTYSVFYRKMSERVGNKNAEQVFRQVFEGLGLQLMNCPLDLFVEQKVYDIVDARPIQLLSLLKQEQDNIAGVQKMASDKLFPPQLVNANKVMQLVTSTMLKKLYGIDLRKQYQATKLQMEQAQDLFDEYEAYEESFKDGDEYELIEYFATSLRMTDFISLKDKLPKNETPAFDDEEPARSHLTPEEQEQQDAFDKTYGEHKNPLLDMMVTMYMVAALEYFDGMPMEEIRKIAFQIAMLGVGGIDPNKKGYQILAMPDKQFSGHELLAYYYVSWKIAEPEKLKMLGLPFDDNYITAKQMFDAKKGNGKK